MAVKPETLADYQCRPEDLDPAKILAFLPGWRGDMYPSSRSDFSSRITWHFREPNNRLVVEIDTNIPEKGNRATISSAENPNLLIKHIAGARLYVENLQLLVAQVQPTQITLELHGSDESCYLVRERKDSYQREYTLSLWKGRKASRVPHWTDRIPLCKPGSPELFVDINIPRLATV